MYLYHLNIYCPYTTKLKRYYKTHEEAEAMAVEFFENNFPFDVAFAKYGVDRTIEMVENGYQITRIAFERANLFFEGSSESITSIKEVINEDN